MNVTTTFTETITLADETYAFTGRIDVQDNAVDRFCAYYADDEALCLLIQDDEGAPAHPWYDAAYDALVQALARYTGWEQEMIAEHPYIDVWEPAIAYHQIPSGAHV